MVVINGYKIIAKIYESINSEVYRGIKEEDNQSVILKVLKQDYPTPEELRRYQIEYEILKKLNTDKVIKVYGLENYQRTLIILLEDFGAQSLKQWMTENCLTIEEFLSLAIKITEGLAEIHLANIIHKDLNPANIVINPETGQLKIIDFGISTCLTRENPTLKHPNLLEGTLAYISPEQTGRMNRSLDYRTDFYSLGVTFYEMLTGNLPFVNTDPLELVHAHLALQPLKPEEIKPEIPLTVAKIIMKLMAKIPEERYQSALGIKTDLEICLNQLETTGEIQNFTLGSQDICQKFQIPEKLYGRQREIAILQEAIEKISNEGTGKKQQEMMLVVGESGSGKTVLVQESYQAIAAKQGYFISGKFEQFKRNIPYSAIVSAFTQLIRQILSESETKLNYWREKLLSALGVNAQVISDIIPELELIIGKQPAVAKLKGNEAQNRFNLVFQNFISVFAINKHPLVLFLDDLQWIDAASLQLIEILLGDYTAQSLLLIGSYRNNEVTPTHPLIINLEKLAQLGVIINKITLAPLKVNDISQLIADTLKSQIESVKPLAELVLNKTGGNPFFVNEFLKTLFTSNLINFEINSRSWQWKIEQIEAMNITDNVVELMINKLKQLPESTQNILSIAACLGVEFELNILSLICEQPPRGINSELHAVTNSGLIIPTSAIDKNLLIQNYKFSHDRIQEAALYLLEKEEKKVIHLKIGRLLLQHSASENLSEKIFEIADHFKLGRELITHQQEKDEIAKVNLNAGQKAKASAAYKPAYNYFNTGIKLLSNNCWETQYNLSLTLYIEAAESAYLCGLSAQMEQLTEEVLQQANTLLDKVKVYEVKIQSYLAEKKFFVALQTGISVLKLLGVKLPDPPSQEEVEEKLAEVDLILAERDTSDLLEIPQLTDENKLAVTQTLSSIIVPAFISNRQLFYLVVLEKIKIFLESGYTHLSAYAYVWYGIILSERGELNKGYQFGELAVRLWSKFQVKELKAKIYVLFNVYMALWKKHDKEILPHFLEAYVSGLETGDVEYAAWALNNYSVHSCFSGKELEKLELEMVKYAEKISQLKQTTVANYHAIYQQMVVQMLRGSGEHPYCLMGEYYNEEQMLVLYQEQKDSIGLAMFYAVKMFLCYLFGAYIKALEIANLAEQNIGSVQVTPLIAIIHYLYGSLARIAVCDQVKDEQQELLLNQVEANLKIIKNLADFAPQKFQHKYDLVAAEKARVEGKNWEAAALYEQAIKGAKENQYIQEEALAYELAARFYFAQGMGKIAEIYLQEAHYCYSSYAAWAKVKQLEATYPQLLLKSSNKLKLTTTANTSGEALDLATVLKASQAISSEVVLEELLRKLLKIIMENAGAETGFLLLEKEGEFLIEAEGSVNSEKITVFQSKPIHNNLPASIINYVARTAESVVLDDASKEGTFTNDPYIQEYQPKSILCVPLINQGKLLSIVYLENNLTIGVFTPDRLEVIKLLSAQAVISIENARLYQTLEAKVAERTAQLAQANEEITLLNELLKQENLRMSAELEVAQQLQKMVLPKPSELESIEELEIVGFMQPADEVGGDYYEVLSHNGRVIIGIGDVTGHGLASGVLMLMVQTAVRTLIESEQTDPVGLLNTLNKTIYKNVERMNLNRHLTLAILDYQKRTLRVSGQHENLIIIRSSGEVELINTLDLGFPIGLDEEIADFLGEEKLNLNSDDVVVLYTDGVTEAEDINEVQYGLEKLCEVVRVNHHKTSEEIKQAIIDNLRQHIGEQKIFDDITFLVIKQK